MFSSIEYQKFAVHLLNTTSPSKPTSVDQAKRPVKALYEKYTAWVGQAALHFKNRHLDLINDKSSLTKLFEEIEDAKRHPAVTTQVTDKVIKAKTVADLAAEELRDQKELKRPAGDELGQERPREHLVSLFYRNRDPRLQAAAAAAGAQEPPAKRLCAPEGVPLKKEEGELLLDEVLQGEGINEEILSHLPDLEGQQTSLQGEGQDQAPTEAADSAEIHADYRALFSLSPTTSNE